MSQPLLRLEPLEAPHASALARQFRDPRIAAMTGLPALADPSHAAQWVAQRLGEPADAKVLMHADDGLVGYCELLPSGDETFLTLWVGADFQGQGFGGQLVSLACNHALARGASLLLSAAYDTNERSLRSLRRFGFRELGIRALPPDHGRTFLYFPAGRLSEGPATQRLRGYCARIASGLEFPPEASRHEAARSPLSA